jgi:chromosome segregation ATPase
MNEMPFKNLAQAREEYIKLSEELAAAKEQLGRFDALEAENSDLKTQLETAQKFVADGIAQIASINATRALEQGVIAAKDDEIKQLKAGLDVLKIKCTDLEKNQRSVKAQARELVAASAGAPAAVDNSEMEMTADDIGKAMRAETDQKKIHALYRQFNKLREAAAAK